MGLQTHNRWKKFYGHDLFRIEESVLFEVIPFNICILPYKLTNLQIQMFMQAHHRFDLCCIYFLF